jgi:hypothetical protein
MDQLPGSLGAVWERIGIVRSLMSDFDRMGEQY